MSCLHEWTRRKTKERLAREPFVPKLVIVSLWPFVMLGTVVFMTWSNGRIVKRRSGRSILLQVIDQVKLSVTKGVPPVWYYVFELFRPELAQHAGEYLLRYQTKSGGIYSDLRRYSGAFGDNTFGDKVLFFEFCRQSKLATADILCTVNGSVVTWISAWQECLPQRDIFAKPRRARGGRGAERWLWSGGTYTDQKGTSLDANGLLEHLKERSKNEAYLLQPRLMNHPDLAAINIGALSTVRVLICRNEAWEPEIVHAYMRMGARPESVVDNVHAGGLAAPVDIECGCLGMATNLGISANMGWVKKHPVTGAMIAGFEVPRWAEVKALALEAHRGMPDMCVAGWDIAILENGLCLVEGNQAPCVDSTQRMLLRPIGNERLGQLIAFHLKRAEAGQAPPRPHALHRRADAEQKPHKRNRMSDARSRFHGNRTDSAPDG